MLELSGCLQIYEAPRSISIRLKSLKRWPSSCPLFLVVSLFAVSQARWGSVRKP